jgi:hypothetical protein
MKKLVAASMTCLIYASSLGTVHAQATFHEEYINGSACIAYPPITSPTFNAFAYKQLLYGRNNVQAFCNIALSNEWPVDRLSAVGFYATAASGVVRAHVCVSSMTGATSCGADATIAAGTSALGWAAPPASMPIDPLSAYLEVFFEGGNWSLLKLVIPFWHP